MRNRSIQCLFLFGIFSMVFALQSCRETDDLRSELDSLKDRVKLLEEASQKLNTSIESYRKLLSGSVIVGITPIEKGYEVELSDGSKITVISGENIDALIPEISIDDEGYWVYRTDKSGSFTPMTDKDGNKILAIPHNAAGEPIESPKLRVDRDGYWEVSYDGGKTYIHLTNENGKVPATGSGMGGSTSLFQSVTYNQDTKELEMVLAADGRKVVLPVIDTFFLKVSGAEGEQAFPLSEKRLYEVEQGDIAQAMIQAPDGWQVKLEEQLLTIVAPSKNEVEKTETIRIVITSSKNYIRIVPITVRLLTTGYDANACTAWNEFNTNAPGNILPDFSYAGYKHGEVAPPDVYSLGYTTYNIKDYKTDGKTDREAFQAIINRIGTGKANARALIYFPEGEYTLHTEADDVNGTSQTLNLIMGGVVLKGAGRNKTFLKMAAPNQPANPSQMWSSPVMISIRHNGGKGLVKLAGVTQNAAKGEFSVNVDATTGIAKESWVCLKLTNNDPAVIKEELLGRTPESSWTDLINNGVQIYEYHQVKSVSGNKVTFYEPLLHAVNKDYGWELCDYPHYENVGVEDLTFVGQAKENFVHHGSWEDDGAYKPIDFVRMTNSWMRRVGFRSVSEAFTISSSANVSAYDITIEGNRGHSAIRSQASSRVFIGKVADRSSGTTDSETWNPAEYKENIGQYHSCGVSQQSIGTVIWNVTWGSDACFESHAKQPRATLFDQCKGAFMQFREGGDIAQLPNHLDDLTFWNFEATGSSPKTKTPFQWWPSDNIWMKNLPPTIIGFHGYGITFDPNQVKRIESGGMEVQPYSLYEAQLRKRLGVVPAWLNSIK